LISRWSTALSMDRSLPLLPFLFAVALAAGLALRDRPPKPIPIDFPSLIGIPLGALPQEAVAPKPLDLPTAPPTAVSPIEAVPPESPLTSTEPSSAATAPGAQRTLPAARAGPDTWTDHLPRAIGAESGAGNINLRPKQRTVVATLVGTILKSLQRIRSTALGNAKPAARHLPMTQPAQNHAKLRQTATIAAPRPNFTSGSLGGPAPQRAVLGGPVPWPARYASNLDGSNLRRHY
jgi:hypothetical protein